MMKILYIYIYIYIYFVNEEVIQQKYLYDHAAGLDY